MARAHRARLLPGLGAEERDQHGPAVESFQDPRRSGPGGESEGEGGGKGSQGLRKSLSKERSFRVRTRVLPLIPLF